MTDLRPTSGLPSAKGSPFVSGNFNKFFFGIIIAAIVLCAIAFAVVAGLHHHASAASPSPKSELMR